MNEQGGGGRRREEIASSRPLFWCTATYFALVLLVGGAGQHYPLLTASIEMLGLGLLVFAALVRGVGRLLTPSALANALLAFAILLPLAQLIPLSWSVWAGLPGHDLAAAVIEAAGLSGGSRPLSLNPSATMGSTLSLIPPAALFLIASRFGIRECRGLLALCVGIALLSAILGALQMATGGAASIWPSAHATNSPGLFVNRNHQATFLLIAIPLAAGLAGAARASTLHRTAAAGVILVLTAGVVATTSRMGLVLLPLALAASLALLIPDLLSVKRLLILAGTLGAAVLLLWQSSAVGLVISRFAAHDVRFDYWVDTWLGTSQFWPWGSGIGTFADVFPSLENLNVVGPARVPHAHNDYLQLALEGGLPALLLLVAFGALLVIGAIRAFHAERSTRLLKLASLAGIIVVLLHSGVDYPARMFAISASCALLLAVFIGSMHQRERPR